MSIYLPKLGFGAAGLGNLFRPISETDAEATLEAAWHAGIRYYDTAPFYGFGLSERRIGDALRGKQGYVLSTKIGRVLMPDIGADTSIVRHGFASPLPFESMFDYTYCGVMRSYEASLQRLGLASIDVIFVHDIGRATHGSEHERHWHDFFEGGGYRALDDLRAAGDIQAIGLGVNETAACIDAMQEGQFDLFLLAGRYTLLEQTALDEMLPICAAHSARAVIGGVYNSGILATGVRENQSPRYNYAPASADVITRVEKMEAVCKRFEVPLAAVALQFVGAHSEIASVIPGLSSIHEVAQTMDLWQTPIPAAVWAALKEESLIRVDAPVPTQI